jgi:hypothetical protein
MLKWAIHPFVYIHPRSLHICTVDDHWQTSRWHEHTCQTCFKLDVVSSMHYVRDLGRR